MTLDEFVDELGFGVREFFRTLRYYLIPNKEDRIKRLAYKLHDALDITGTLDSIFENQRRIELGKEPLWSRSLDDYFLKKLRKKGFINYETEKKHLFGRHYIDEPVIETMKLTDKGKILYTDLFYGIKPSVEQLKRSVYRLEDGKVKWVDFKEIP